MLALFLCVSMVTSSFLPKPFYALRYSPFRTDTSCPSDAQITEDLMLLKNQTELLMMDDGFSDCGYEASVLMIAEEHNLRVTLALEIRDGNTFDKQLTALKNSIAPLNSTQKVALYSLVVGRQISGLPIVSYIEKVKEYLKTDSSLSHVLITYSDVEFPSQETVNAVDYVTIDAPYFDVAVVSSTYEPFSIPKIILDLWVETQKLYSKPLVIGRFGWPSKVRNPINGDESPGQWAEVGYIPNSNDTSYIIHSVVCQTRVPKLAIIWNEAFDRDWYYKDDDYLRNINCNYGVAYANRTLKPWLQEATFCSPPEIL